MSEDPFADLKHHVRERWSQGNYAAIAELLLPAAQGLVDACAISAGQEVLDVAAGNGNLAILAAEEGASVVASDITPAMLELGRERAAADGVDIEWVEADAEALPFDDRSFDCAASVFGAMLAPRPEVVASELFRVVRPGGTVGMACWTPESFQGRIINTLNRYGSLGANVPLVTDWGREEVVRERFEDLAGSIQIEEKAIRFEFESLPALGAWFRENLAPPSQAEGADSPEEAREKVVGIVNEVNQADDGSVLIDAGYLEIVARRRG
jgi:ubiquinone/menaquinone biosynthesis C-methylase UbiE